MLYRHSQRYGLFTFPEKAHLHFLSFCIVKHVLLSALIVVVIVAFGSLLYFQPDYVRDQV